MYARIAKKNEKVKLCNTWVKKGSKMNIWIETKQICDPGPQNQS